MIFNHDFILALYAVFIKDNPTAFSFAAVNQTIGLFLGSMFSVYFCTEVKVYIFIGIIILSLICYIILLIINKEIEVVEPKKIEIQKKSVFKI